MTIRPNNEVSVKLNSLVFTLSTHEVRVRGMRRNGSVWLFNHDPGTVPELVSEPISSPRFFERQLNFDNTRCAEGFELRRLADTIVIPINPEHERRVRCIGWCDAAVLVAAIFAAVK